VKRGPIIYILGEGRGGLKNRILAWMKHHQAARIEPVSFVYDAVQFKNPQDVLALRTQIDACNVKPAMLFIDTFARSAVGVDENDAMHIGQWIDAVTRLQHDMRVDVVALHHAQKAPNDDRRGRSVRERGSSAFIGAVDTVIRLSSDGKKVRVSCEKQKGSEQFAPFTLDVKVIDLGLNEYGEPASSCVLVDQDDTRVAANGLSDECQRMLSMLGELPTETAERGEWLAKTGLRERTFDRHRKELETVGYISRAEKRGSYTITQAGRLAIANESPTSSHGERTQDVAATPPPPRRGGVATGEMATRDDNEADRFDGYSINSTESASRKGINDEV
jgi:hypothetical protein